MKILLISPLPGVDPACGDVTYTESLLASPPEGVQYETYTEAMQRGTLREHGNRKALQEAFASKEGILREIFLTAGAHLVNRLRKAHWLFWEPFRFFSVKPGEYDAIHLNVFSARFLNLPCPLVVSNAAPLRYLYMQARNQSASRVRWLELCEKALGWLFGGVNLISYSLPQTSRVISFTQYLKDWYVAEGIMPADAIDVASVFLPSVPMAPPNPNPKRIGFMSKDFEARGGLTLLKAFDKVRQVRPDAELVIRSGDRRSNPEDEAKGITWVPYVSREELMERILPSFDVYAYPTEFDGFYSLVEAMSRGIPIATSDYQSIPEFVDYGRAGMVSPVGDADALAENILKLLEPETNARYRLAARAFFEENYSAEAVLPRLRKSYAAAIQSKTEEARTEVRDAAAVAAR